MEQASAALTQLLQRMQQQSAMAFTSDPKAASRELERRKAECYNREEGTLNQQDNYNCPLCRNRGKTVELVMEDGEEKAKFFECRCMNVRSTIARMQRSGRQDVISKYTLDSFLVENDFQRTLKEAAQGYLKAGTGWFFIGGQSGCGKTTTLRMIAGFESPETLPLHGLAGGCAPAEKAAAQRRGRILRRR